MDLNTIQKFIKKQKVSFVCSVDENGCPNVKAMTSSLRVKQFLNNPNASIYFYHKGLIKYTGVMLVGKMEVLTDSDYCVLRFTAQSGRYYCDLKTESFEV